LAARARGERDLVVLIVRSRIDDGVNVVAGEQIAIVGGDPWRADFLASPRIGVANARDLDVGTQPESGDMNAQRGSACADDADSKQTGSVSKTSQAEACVTTC
jgi:hypothetical protein